MLEKYRSKYRALVVCENTHQAVVSENLSSDVSGCGRRRIKVERALIKIARKMINLSTTDKDRRLDFHIGLLCF